LFDGVFLNSGSTMKTRFFLTLAAACALAACASQNGVHPVKITQTQNSVSLQGYPACGPEPFRDAVPAEETHRCYFPMTGAEAPLYNTAVKRAAFGRQYFFAACRPLSERMIESKASTAEPIVRVGFACR
jgi:hypothetical protein